MKISLRTMSRILKDDLHLGAYKRATGYLLTEKFKKIRHDRTKQLLLQKFKNNVYCKILYTDEKIFSVKSCSTNKMIAFTRSHPKMLEINSPEFSEATI